MLKYTFLVVLGVHTLCFSGEKKAELAPFNEDINFQALLAKVSKKELNEKQKKEIKKNIDVIIEQADIGKSKVLSNDTLWAGIILFLKNNGDIKTLRRILNSKNHIARSNAIFLYEPTKLESTFSFWIIKYKSESVASVKELVLVKLAEIYNEVPKDELSYFNKILTGNNMKSEQLRKVFNNKPSEPSCHGIESPTPKLPIPDIKVND